MALSLAWAIFGVFFFIFFISSIAVSIFILQRLKWNHKWVLWEEQANGQLMITRRGRCRKMPFGDGGEEIFLLKGKPIWKVAYGKRIGKNQIAWAVGQDGYWYNVSGGSLDKKLRELGVYPVDRDMRYAYASARKGIENRYNQKSFMEQYGTIIAFGMLGLCILAMCAFAWFTYNGQAKIATINNAGLETQQKTMELANQVLANIANIKTGGSGATTG